MRNTQAPRGGTAVAAWLFTLTAFVSAMILIGGATRLTDSGLSITEWNAAKHFVPPITEHGWEKEFQLYRQTTEYQVQNRGMSLDEFRFIYLWEWGHRFLGQMVGLVFAVPFAFFAATGRLKGRLGPVLALGLLGAFQGAVGWWMVKSGLAGRLDVSPLRLATHLGIAFVIVAFAFRLGLDVLSPGGAGAKQSRRWVWALAALVYAQILLGALVAGSDAGRAFTDWPTIGGRWLPDYSQWGGLENFTQNLAAVQFHHRTAGYLAAALAIALVFTLGRKGSGSARTAAVLVGACVALQVVLGVVTVVLGAPLWVSLLHQAGALALWLSIWLWDKALSMR